MRDLNEIFVSSQTTVIDLGGGGASWLRLSREWSSRAKTLVIMLGTNDVSRAPLTTEGKW